MALLLVRVRRHHVAGGDLHVEGPGEGVEQIGGELRVGPAGGGQEAGAEILARDLEHHQITRRVANHVVGGLTEDSFAGVGESLPGHDHHIRVVAPGGGEDPLLDPVSDHQVGVDGRATFLCGLSGAAKQGFFVMGEAHALVDGQLLRHLDDGRRHQPAAAQLGDRNREFEQGLDEVRIVDDHHHRVLYRRFVGAARRHQHLRFDIVGELVGVAVIDQQPQHDPGDGDVPGDRLELELIQGEEDVEHDAENRRHRIQRDLVSALDLGRLASKRDDRQVHESKGQQKDQAGGRADCLDGQGDRHDEQDDAGDDDGGARCPAQWVNVRHLCRQPTVPGHRKGDPGGGEDSGVEGRHGRQQTAEHDDDDTKGRHELLGGPDDGRFTVFAEELPRGHVVDRDRTE